MAIARLCIPFYPDLYGAQALANPEWGTKRICQNCGTKFYDLRREPIQCPKCQTEYDPEALLKTRRSRPLPADKEVAPVAELESEVEAPEKELLEEEDDEVAEVVADDEDEDLIEDASELGEDEDDMAEVIEGVDDEEER